MKIGHLSSLRHGHLASRAGEEVRFNYINYQLNPAASCVSDMTSPWQQPYWGGYHHEPSGDPNQFGWAPPRR